MLIRNTKSVYRHEIERKLGKDASAKQVLDHIFGDYYDNDKGIDYVISKWSSCKKTKMQRFNIVLAVIFIILRSPYQYITDGYLGFDNKTKFGRWVLRNTGDLKD